MASQTEDVTAGQSPISNQNSPIVNQQSSIANEQSPITNRKSPISNKKSTGPRTLEGKRRSSRNAYKHGLYSKSSFFWDAATDLGEDPRDFRRLLNGLVEARRPADALERVLVEDIALLIWKKARLDAAESAVQVCNLQKHDLERRKQFAQVGRDVSSALQSEVREKGLRTNLDAPGKFEKVLSILDILVNMAEKNDFSFTMQEFLRGLYGVEPTLRGAGLFNNYFQLSRMKPDTQEFTDAKILFGARLAEEISDVAQEYELFLHEHVENTRAARMAATAPSHAQWAAIIRQQNALHRQLERKIRLLEEMQEKRKREEARFLDNYQASLRRNPSGGTNGGRQRRARSSPEAATQCVGASGAGPGPNAHRRQSGFGASATVRPCKPRGFHHRESLRAAELQKTQICATQFPTPTPGPPRPAPDGAGPRLMKTPATGHPLPQGGEGWRHAAQRRKKILNRGNELKDILQAKGLASTCRAKRTPFCAQKVVIEAEKSGISVQKNAALPVSRGMRKASRAVKNSTWRDFALCHPLRIHEERKGFTPRRKVRQGRKAKNGLRLCVLLRLTGRRSLPAGQAAEPQVVADRIEDNLDKLSYAVMLVPVPIQSLESAKRDEKPANWLSAPQTRSPSQPGKARENYLRLKERCANVSENKGSGLETPAQSWNVIENKGSYSLAAGMLLKINVVNVRKFPVDVKMVSYKVVSIAKTCESSAFLSASIP